MLAGSPVSAECSAWFYRNVNRDLWLATGSGGTDTCCGLAGGTPTLPVHAGEIQARHLGARPEAAANRDAMANPASLEAYVSFAKQWPTVEE